MAWEENSRISLHMQLIAILSRIGVSVVPIMADGTQFGNNKPTDVLQFC